MHNKKLSLVLRFAVALQLCPLHAVADDAAPAGARPRSHYRHGAEGPRGPAENGGSGHGDCRRRPRQRRCARHPRRAEPDAVGALHGRERLDRALYPRCRVHAGPAQHRAAQCLQLQWRLHPARRHQRRAVRHRVRRAVARSPGHAVRPCGPRRRRQRRVQPSDAGSRDQWPARGRRLFAAARHDRAEPAGVGPARVARSVRLHRARRVPEDGR
jgi:hypothetical protein